MQRISRFIRSIFIEDKTPSIKHYPLTGRFYPKIGKYYLQKCHVSGIMHLNEPEFFATSSYGESEEEAKRLIDLYLEQHENKGVSSLGVDFEPSIQDAVNVVTQQLEEQGRKVRFSYYLEPDADDIAVDIEKLEYVSVIDAPEKALDDVPLQSNELDTLRATKSALKKEIKLINRRIKEIEGNINPDRNEKHN